MKTKLAVLLVCLFAVTCQAQTFVRYAITNWVVQSVGMTNSFGGSDYVPIIYTNSLSVIVPANTLFRGSVVTTTAFDVSVVYPDCQKPIPISNVNDTEGRLKQVLGPATVVLNANGDGVQIDGIGGFDDAVILTAEFLPVNVAPATTGFAVQPPNSTAQIGLETSTDLRMWQASTPGNYGLTNSARFFRLNLNVTP